MSSENRELVEKGLKSLKRSLNASKSAIEYENNIVEFRRKHEGGLGSDANQG